MLVNASFAATSIAISNERSKKDLLNYMALDESISIPQDMRLSSYPRHEERRLPQPKQAQSTSSRTL